jgi:SAM-dependent methyltransferase
MDSQKKYISIVSYHEYLLEQYGDTYLGVNWPKKEDVPTRYNMMLGVLKQKGSDKISLLDFGCGASHLYEYILQHKYHYIDYSGLDLSEKFIELSKRKFPSNKYYCLDILTDQDSLPDFDYIVMNGIFTQKLALSFDDMFDYLKAVVSKLFLNSRIGIAFNVMSKQVDWERDDLFHLPFDTLASFLTKHVSRHFVIRHDYGLFEYTTYVYKKPNHT